MMGTQDDDDIGSFAAVRRDLMKAVGDAQTKPTHPQRFENRGARNAVVTEK